MGMKSLLPILLFTGLVVLYFSPLTLCQNTELEWVNTLAGLVIREDAKSGEKVATVKAVYKGTTDSSGIQYGFTSGLLLKGEYLEMKDNVSGEIYVGSKSLNYDRPLGNDGIPVDLFQKFFTVIAAEGRNRVRLTNTQEVGIFNLNDEKPLFVNNSLTVNISENTVIPRDGLLILQYIKIVDLDGYFTNVDGLQTSLELCVIPGGSDNILDCPSWFFLRPVGSADNFVEYRNLYLNTSLDYEDVLDSFQLKIRAWDGENEGNTDVIITVNNEQDQPPIWTLLPSNTNTDDNTPVGDLSIIVRAIDGDNLNRPVLYTIERGPENFGVPASEIFEINNRTGRVTNKVPLDLEDTKYFKFNGTQTRNIWDIPLLACELVNENPDVASTNLDQDCTSVETIKVTIIDINDNRPLLSQPNYTYLIPEDIQDGLLLQNPPIEVTDADTDPFSMFTTVLESPYQEFGLFGQNFTPSIIIRNTSLIDYDYGIRQYNLTIRTFDVGDPTLFSTASVFIKVRDVNDIIPEFGSTVYTAQVSETAPEGTDVNIAPFRIEAFDIDTGLFGKQGIRYSLKGIGEELFYINDLDGTVTVAACGTYGVFPCIDYDIGEKLYNFDVLAIDELGEIGKGLTGTATLQIQITDENDNPPRMVRNSVFASIDEGQREFDPPLIIEASDVDTASVLVFSIQPGLDSGFWKIDSGTGEITVGKGGNEPIYFSDKIGGKHQLLVLVSDGVNPPAQTDVYITVNDINDKSPIFFPTIYRRVINETTPAGTYLLTVSATDNDDPTTKNGQLEYTANNLGGNFFLNKTTGDFFTSNSAPFEPGLIYNFSVRVNDLGTPTLDDFATIIIEILDENNKDPFIIPVLQNFVVKETELPDYRVGSVTARDPDKDANLVLRFIEDDNFPKEARNAQGFPTNISIYDFRNIFRIDPSGTIYVNGKLNSSVANIVTYPVEVEDISAPTKQTGVGRVIITVTAVNINPPQILSGNVTFVDEERPPFTNIYQTVATDQNGIDRYELTDQPNNFFTINPVSGSVQTFGRIDYDGAGMLNSSYFVVTVYDRGDPQLSSSLNVTVFVRNINDNIPRFVRDLNQTETSVNLYTASIFENSPNGTEVVQVFAVDDDRPDENEFHLVNFFMNNDRFDVDPNTGKVFVRLRNDAELDREVTPIILVQVVARDNPNRTISQIQRQNVAKIRIALRDVNDNIPAFTKADFRVRIFENTSPNTFILQLFYTDRDLGNFAIANFTKLAGGTDVEDLFNVTREDGQVKVAKDLTGKVGIYTFFVQAQDNLGAGLTANATVTVDVRKSGNLPPQFIVPPVDNMTAFVLEEQYYGMLIFDVSARDTDSEENGIVDYSLIYEGVTTNSTPEFTINRVTGVIHADIIFDRERVDRYVLLLKASDRADNSLETTRFLTIIIKDVNDNVPTFDENEVEFTVNENVGVGFSVGQVTATDLDLNPVIVYEIISGNENGVFRLDRMTGEIFTNQPLDTEDQSIYYIDILATNDEPEYTVIRNRRKRAVDPSIVTAKIRIGDINDLAPAFLEDRYYGCISTRSPYGKHIVTVSAVDRDAVGTGIVRYTLNKTEDRGTDVGNDYFTIHPRFGIVTNTVLMRNYVDKTFDLTVNARDGIDPADSESSNTNVKVFVTQPGKEAKLLITQNTAEVRLYQQQIQSIIEQSTDIDYLCIIDIQDHEIDSVGSTTTLWSDVYVAGVREESDGSMNILGSRELVNIINFERNRRGNDFDLLYIKEVEAASSSDELDLDDKAVIIILIIIAVLIFLVIIFCIVAFMCIKAAKTQKKRRLVHKTNSPPPPAPVIIAEPAPEPVIYDNRGFIQEIDQPMVQEQEVISTEPIHVEYAVVKKGSPSPVVDYEPEYQYPEPVDDEQVIIVPLDDGPPQQVAVFEAEPEDEYRIVTEVVNE